MKLDPGELPQSLASAVDLRPAQCPIGGETDAKLVFRYDAPPPGETGFRRGSGEAYHREVWQFERSRHFVSRHEMDVSTGYGGDYVDAAYSDGNGVSAAFERIIVLSPEKSDNVGRMARVQAFAQNHLAAGSGVRLLDVGAGIGVFPHVVKQAGWTCTAIDPDKRAVTHIRNRVGAEAICGDFMTVNGIGKFDIITFNKVLEHVEDPVAMLKRAHEFLSPGGFVYLEVPDGEMAALRGAGREEFFIEHLHAFSLMSATMVCDRAGFSPAIVERLQEPSKKLTLRAFCH